MKIIRFKGSSFIIRPFSQIDMTIINISIYNVRLNDEVISFFAETGLFQL